MKTNDDKIRCWCAGFDQSQQLTTYTLSLDYKYIKAMYIQQTAQAKRYVDKRNNDREKLFYIISACYLPCANFADIIYFYKDMT